MFPAAKSSTQLELTSPPTINYNCVAWAAEDVERWWWPLDRDKQSYWPEGALKEETVPAFVDAFARLGYVVASDPAHEPALQKVAIFVRNGRPEHMARQLADGRWTSKMGDKHDIAHSLRDLEGEAYGKVAQILSRRLAVRRLEKPNKS